MSLIRAAVSRLRPRKALRAGTLSLRLPAMRPGAPFSVMVVSLAPGASHPPIRHAHTHEWFTVLRGNQTARIGGRTRRLGRGVCVHMPPGTVHSFRAGPRGVEVLAIFSPPLDLRDPDIVKA
jgi:quercetin dioxygenase-like cupin family protein